MQAWDPASSEMLAAFRLPRQAGRLGALLFALLLLWLAAAPAPAGAAVTCPNSNPVVDENQCHTGTSSWQINDYSPDLGGFTTQTSVNLGQSVVAEDRPQRAGLLQRQGQHRRLPDGLLRRPRRAASSTAPATSRSTTTTPATRWTRPPGRSTAGTGARPTRSRAAPCPASGVYLAKLTASTGEQTAVVFTVRDDNRAPSSRLLYVLPVDSYQAYNTVRRQVALLRHRGRQHRLGNQPRGQGLLQPAPRPGRRVARTGSSGPTSTCSPGSSSRATTSPTPTTSRSPPTPSSCSSTTPSSSPATPSTGARSSSTASRRPATPASTSPRSAPTPPTGRSATRTASGPWSATRRSRAAAPRAPARSAPTTGARTACREPPTTRSAPTASPGPPTTTRRTRPRPAATTARRPATPGAPAGRPRRPRPAREPALRRHVRRRQRRSRLPGHGARRATPTASSPADRIWRNTGISQNSSTNIGTNLVGWEWDAVPTQAQYTSRQPANVIRLSATNVQVASDNSWLQDEGRAAQHHAPARPAGHGQRGQVHGAERRLVFAAGTMKWSCGLSRRRRSADRAGDLQRLLGHGRAARRRPAMASRSTRAAPTRRRSRASRSPPTRPRRPRPSPSTPPASSDPDGSIVNYEWDLDGDGSFETNSGTNPIVTHTYTAEGEGTYNVRLRVTDNGGATDLAVRTLDGDRQPAADRLLHGHPEPGARGPDRRPSTAPAPATPTGRSPSTSGTSTATAPTRPTPASTPTTTKTYATPGTVNVGLRVTDNGGKTATTTVTVTVKPGGISSYRDAVLDTPGLRQLLADGRVERADLRRQRGREPGHRFRERRHLRRARRRPGDPNTAARFDGSTDYASAPRQPLRHQQGDGRVLAEVELRQRRPHRDGVHQQLPRQRRRLPDRPELALAAGRRSSRSGSAATARATPPTSTSPAPGVWHHYAFVLDSSAPAATQITPYVDGQAVPYTKLDSGTGAGNFANSTLYMMSRAGTSLFGNGDLDEVAIYNRALSAGDDHRALQQLRHQPPPGGRLPDHAGPRRRPDQQVTFDASSSHDPDGIDRPATSGTSTATGPTRPTRGTNPIVTHTYTSEAPRARTTSACGSPTT